LLQKQPSFKYFLQNISCVCEHFIDLTHQNMVSALNKSLNWSVKSRIEQHSYKDQFFDLNLDISFLR
jgi:hypothetical protein